MSRVRRHHVTSNVKGGSVTSSPKKAGGTETGIARVVEVAFQGLGGEKGAQQPCLAVKGPPWNLWAGPQHVESIPRRWSVWEARLEHFTKSLKSELEEASEIIKADLFIEKMVAWRRKDLAVLEQACPWISIPNMANLLALVFILSTSSSLGGTRSMRISVWLVKGLEAAEMEWILRRKTDVTCALLQGHSSTPVRQETVPLILALFSKKKQTPSSCVEDIVAIMIPEPKGKEIVSLLERNITVTMYITIGTRNLQKYVSRTSVVFVSISFIVLMIISLAWLVFYYIQRFRYANARDRNQRRLGDAAKKAISKLQVRTIKKGDKETEPDFDNCAVCIEGYKPNDVVRILPCRHLFHKSCVDPWLLDHRTCPMCKMNILKALGIPPNADCMDDLPTDFEGSLGGPPTNQITGASDTTVNESSVTLDPAVRTVGALQVVPDTDPTPQEGEVIFTTNSEQEPAVSSDSDISLIMAMEVGLSDVELSTDQDCEEVKS
ncbi:RING finger protein 150 [Puma concolor]|uniref:RING finger protein 150 n=2 Tax=Feliformia TaxID=379583 RepID=A0A6P6HRF3_PUMCO|nr:RING finger protein 150 [Puma concolor]